MSLMKRLHPVNEAQGRGDNSHKNYVPKLFLLRFILLFIIKSLLLYHLQWDTQFF
jgi:hypothetical protein